MEAHLLAVVAEGSWERVYLSPQVNDFEVCQFVGELALVEWKPAGRLPPPGEGLGLRVQRYGFEEWWQLFTNRQLTALVLFSDLLEEVRDQIFTDAKGTGFRDDKTRLRDGGTGVQAYADAVVTYLALTIDKLADLGNSLCRWEPVAQCPRGLFSKQAIGMIWDFAEGNPLGSSSGSWKVVLDGFERAFKSKAWPPPSVPEACVTQADARFLVRNTSEVIISTDPPYYDNIGYADISDFFYVWLRRNLADVWPEECQTLLTPKSLVQVRSKHLNLREQVLALTAFLNEHRNTLWALARDRVQTGAAQLDIPEHLRDIAKQVARAHQNLDDAALTAIEDAIQNAQTRSRSYLRLEANLHRTTRDAAVAFLQDCNSRQGWHKRSQQDGALGGREYGWSIPSPETIERVLALKERNEQEEHTQEHSATHTQEHPQERPQEQENTPSEHPAASAEPHLNLGPDSF